MMNFYTNVYQHFDSIYVRGYDQGRRFSDRIEYTPYLFEQHPDGAWRTIHNEPVRKLDFSSIKQARDYLKLNEGVVNKTTYGVSNFKYLYVHDAYPDKIEYDSHLVTTVTIDIEV